jgi:hypothetical protein
MPAPGKSFAVFSSEDAVCRQWAEQQTRPGAQEERTANTATGAVVGTGIGAVAGAAIGSASGHAGAGALIGGASGLLAGTAIGAGSGEGYGREAQRRYDNAYMQCMYSYGNQIPGYRPARVATAPPAAPPPASAPPVVASPPPAPVTPPSAPPAAAAPPQAEAVIPETYSPPPLFYLPEAPRFIYSPAMGGYVAVGVPYDLVYTGTEYYYYYGGNWYKSPFYNGPWSYVPNRAYPSLLLKFKIDSIRHHRDMEFRRFQRDRARYDGRFHRPEFRGEPR